MLSPNTILQGRYRVIRQLGHGGMGTVYEALDQRVSAIVALKETNVATYDKSRREFEREARLLANLRHQALPKVTDYFVEDAVEFLVMEYIPGYDLAELLKLRGSSFDVYQVLSWADELLKALEYLHGRMPPIIHHDIKPSNLKLTKEGEIFLLDFGLAEGVPGQIVESQRVRGFTHYFSSLEQIFGQGTDPRSDLYSLGATLYHLLTNELPVAAPVRYEQIEDDKPDPLPAIHKLNPQVPSNVADVIHQAMAIRRKNRPNSATDMRRALHQAEEDAKHTPEAKLRQQEESELQRPHAFGEDKTLSRPDPIIGHVLDSKYKLVARLGEGGMGTVYRARRLLIGDEVAVKVLLKKFVTDAEAVERFRREARAAAMLHHSNIVTIHDFGEARGDDVPAYIVMELIQGESLRELLQRSARIDTERAVSLMRDICAGVGAAHRRNIWHRDLKPDNVIILPPDEDRERETVKVVDFGIAKLRDLSGRPTLTKTGAVMGTPYYMSPEQCLGESLDARSDVYSLGVMLYEMLAGIPPFTAKDSRAVIAKHLTENPYPLPKKLGVPPALEAVIMHALAKEPVNRQPDASMFSNELQAALKLHDSSPVAKTIEANVMLQSTQRSRHTAPQIEMVLIPAGTFMMGPLSLEARHRSDERPQHRVTVQSFYMGKYEVTQAQYWAVVGTNPSHFIDCDECPVENVSWDDAHEFIHKLNGMQNKYRYRLPSEAEWEYACRAGTTEAFAFGDSLSSEQANFNGNYPFGGAAEGVNRQKTTPVGYFQPNAFGLYDMHGNVFEWCEDWYHENYNGAPTDGSAWLRRGEQKSRVLRGGSWSDPAINLRSAFRGRFAPDYRNYFSGFRLAADART